MELAYKKEISLKAIFLKFLVQIILSWILVIALWALLLELSIASSFLIPANAVENAINNWSAQLSGTDPFLPHTLPAGADYACFSKDGTLLFTTLTDESLTQATQLAAADQSNKLSVPHYTYLKFTNTTQTLVLRYQLRASFSAPALRRFFPSAEPFLLLSLLILFFSVLIFFILHYAKKIERELRPLQDAADQIRSQNLNFESSSTHITEFNRVLASLLLLKDELRTSLEEQWNMEQQKKKQISALAHDIKTPLTIVRGNAELLQESNLSEEQQEYNTFILENAAQIQMYVTQILEVSRTRQIITDSTLCSLDQLLSQIEKTAHHLCLAKNLTFTLHAKKLPEGLSLPKEAITRSLLNLIDNAVFYSPSGGVVTLFAEFSSSEPKSILSFSIEDEGRGFSEEALLHATENFYRSDKSRGSSEHFGMGLAITKQIVTELGGTLQLKNRATGGAKVTIKIPI